MKKILTITILIILTSCGCAKIKSVNGVFKDSFLCKRNSPWINKSKRYITYETVENLGLKIINTSKKYHAGVNYDHFPVNMLNDFEAELTFSIQKGYSFTFYLGYRDSKHRDLFTFFNNTKRFNYSRYDNSDIAENNSISCNLNDNDNTLKIKKVNNRITIYLNNQMIMEKDNRPTFKNSFGFGLGNDTEVILKKIRIIDTKYNN